MNQLRMFSLIAVGIASLESGELLFSGAFSMLYIGWFDNSNGSRDFDCREDRATKLPTLESFMLATSIADPIDTILKFWDSKWPTGDIPKLCKRRQNSQCPSFGQEIETSLMACVYPDALPLSSPIKCTSNNLSEKEYFRTRLTTSPATWTKKPWNSAIFRESSLKMKTCRFKYLFSLSRVNQLFPVGLAHIFDHLLNQFRSAKRNEFEWSSTVVIAWIWEQTERIDAQCQGQ